MNKNEHCFIRNNSICVVICLKYFHFFFLFVLIIFNLFLMINPTCCAFQYNSMVPHGNKTIYKAKIGDDRN